MRAMVDAIDSRDVARVAEVAQAFTTHNVPLRTEVAHRIGVRCSAMLSSIHYAMTAPEPMPEIVAALQHAGASIDEAPYPFHSALHMAARLGNLEFARLLLRFGAKEVRGANYAVSWAKSASTVRFFIEHGLTVTHEALLLLFHLNESTVSAQSQIAIARFVIACIPGDYTSIADYSTFCQYVMPVLAAGAHMHNLLTAARTEALRQRYDIFNVWECEKREIARTRIDLIRRRAADICIALHARDISAHEMMQIVEFACEPFSNCVPLHAKWAIVTTVKHFRKDTP
jgi:hypothetical protein